MSTQIVECIPNFSEARRPDVINQITQAIKSVNEIRLLDQSSDMDHNRTVLTFAGPPGPVEEAAFRAIQKAAELIDLDQHTGEHPRIGATDVVPFVPISGVTMEDCIAMARRLGQRVGNELKIPVFLYENAATRPERTNLENIRRGQYEALKKEMGVNPSREPDFGPNRVGPAGATVIGARDPLIAFNVYLTTDDVEIARKIASAIRHSSGGLRFVKGLGLLVDGRAQVSMNLTNFRKTPIARVVEMIRREAERYGVGIHHSELVGLIPQEAMVDAAVWYTQLDQFTPDQVLETRLYAAQTSETAPTFLEELASASPTPGGGSAAAYAGSMGAALVEMVARVTIGKKKYADVEDQMQEILAQAEQFRHALNNAVLEDARAFDAVMDAYRLPQEDPGRADAITAATLNAARVPLQVAEKAVAVLSLAEKCARLGNLNAISDAASGAALARAALTAASLNVRINLAALGEHAEEADLINAVHSLEMEAGHLEEVLKKSLLERGGLNIG